MSDGQNRENAANCTYDAYLVRLWQEGPQTPLRASARSVQSGETVVFATIQALFAFLEAHGAPASNRANTADPTGENFP